MISAGTDTPDLETLNRRVADFLDSSEVTRIASTVPAAGDIPTSRGAISCDDGPGLEVALQRLDTRRAVRALKALRAAAWGDRWLYRGRGASQAWPVVLKALGEPDDDRGAERLLLVNPDLYFSLFPDAPVGGPKGWQAKLDINGRRVAVVALKHVVSRGGGAGIGYALGDGEAFLVRRDREPGPECRSTIRIHQAAPPVVRRDEDGQFLVADEAIAVDVEHAYRFGADAAEG